MPLILAFASWVSEPVLHNLPKDNLEWMNGWKHYDNILRGQEVQPSELKTDVSGDGRLQVGPFHFTFSLCA